MFKRCVVSVAFREPYVTHAFNQRRMLEEMGIAKENYSYFINRYPHRGQMIAVNGNDVSHFQQYLYSFKPHAILDAIRKGYNSIIWLDPSVLPVSNITDLFDRLEQNEMIVNRGDRKLSALCLDRVADWFGVRKKEMDEHDLRDCGGTIYGFNFTKEKARETFDLWLKSEEAGCFGDQDDHCIRNHWADETCIGLSIYKTGVKAVSSGEFKYKNQKDG